MMRNISIWIITCTPFFKLSSCSEVPTLFHITRDRCIEEMVFPCDLDFQNGNFVLRALVNGQEFCLNEHTPDYHFTITRIVGSTVPASDPRLQSGTTGTRSSLAINFYPESIVNHT